MTVGSQTPELDREGFFKLGSQNTPYKLGLKGKTHSTFLKFIHSKSPNHSIYVTLTDYTLGLPVKYKSRQTKLTFGAVPLIILTGERTEKNFFWWVEGYFLRGFWRMGENEFVLSCGWYGF